jgi:hypothetical protein
MQGTEVFLFWRGILSTVTSCYFLVDSINAAEWNSDRRLNAAAAKLLLVICWTEKKRTSRC